MKPRLPDSTTMSPRGGEAGADEISSQLALLWASVALILLLLAPFASWIEAFVWSCPFKSLFGLPCPTCGATRSAVLLATLSWGTALRTYPLMTLGWLALIAGGLWSGMTVWLRLPRPRVPLAVPLWGRVAIVSAVLSNWAYSIATGV